MLNYSIKFSILVDIKLFVDFDDSSGAPSYLLSVLRNFNRSEVFTIGRAEDMVEKMHKKTHHHDIVSDLAQKSTPIMA